MRILVSFISLLVFTSCVKNNPDPSWIYISPWQLVENPDEEGLAGELSHSFKDAYIVINDKIIGYFELPVKLPLLMDGESEIVIYPVVRNNGIASTKRAYPFCVSYKMKAKLEKNKTLSIQPITHYESGLEFWIEDFESASIALFSAPGSKATIVKDNNPNYLKYGGNYGLVNLNLQDSTWAAHTKEFFNVPKNSAEVYLEIDYMTSNNLLTSLNVYINGGEKANPNIQLNAYDYDKIGWKKIYIDLKELVSFHTNAIYYKHFFTAFLDFGKADSKIFLDNVRFIYKK
jgi:hypothetical protein